MNLELLKEWEDKVDRQLSDWPRLAQLIAYQQLYNEGYRISGIEWEIGKELKAMTAK